MKAYHISISRTSRFERSFWDIPTCNQLTVAEKGHVLFDFLLLFWHKPSRCARELLILPGSTILQWLFFFSLKRAKLAPHGTEVINPWACLSGQSSQIQRNFCSSIKHCRRRRENNWLYLLVVIRYRVILQNIMKILKSGALASLLLLFCLFPTQKWVGQGREMLRHKR